MISHLGEYSVFLIVGAMCFDPKMEPRASTPPEPRASTLMEPRASPPLAHGPPMVPHVLAQAIQQEQYLPTMKTAWEHITEQWKEHGEKIAGKRGYAAAYLQSVRLSHPAFPVPSLGCGPDLHNRRLGRIPDGCEDRAHVPHLHAEPRASPVMEPRASTPSGATCFDPKTEPRASPRDVFLRKTGWALRCSFIYLVPQYFLPMRLK